LSELLVVIAVIAVLVALLLPAVQKIREAAALTRCQNQMKQLALALLMYHGTYGGFPAGGVTTVAGDLTTNCGTVNFGTSNIRPRTPWTVLILPYIEQGNLFGKFQINQPFNGLITDSDNGGSLPSAQSVNAAVQLTPNLAFQCPSDPNKLAAAFNSYLGVQGGGTASAASTHSCYTTCLGAGYAVFNNGVLFHNSAIRIPDVTDGTSHVFIVGESKYYQGGGYSSSTPWGSTWASGYRIQATCNFPVNVSATSSPLNTPGISVAFGSYHPGGANFACVDGSVHFISQNISLATYQSLGVRNDGLPLGDPF
jgi:prepilin-type processing-associated H-X9-DG protein